MGLSLTAREREIALLVARGLRNKAIASALQCTEGTVKVHLHNIFQKLSIKSRWVLIAHACDLLSPATSKPRRTFVDAALALDKIAQRFSQILEFCGVSQNPRPFAPRPVIDLFWIGRGTNDACEGFWLSDRRIPSLMQRPMSTVDGPTLLRPPRDEFENRG